MSLNVIKATIEEVSKKLGLTVDEIILFGSRARGDFRKEGDWDVLVVLSEPVSRKTELEAYKLIHRELLFKGVKADLLFISKGELEKVKEDRGFVYHYALKNDLRV